MNPNVYGFSGQVGGTPVKNSGSGGGSTASNNNSNQPQRRMHPIRPVTIKQLLEAQRVGEGVMVVDDREVTQATVVGRVIGYEDDAAANHVAGALTAKHHGYRITDGTGLMVVRQWMHADVQEEPLPVQCYVRASGTVKVWQNAPIITGTVRLVSDCNELNYHYFDVMLTHLRLTKGNKHAKVDSVPAVNNSARTLGVQNMLPGGDGKVFATDVLLNTIKQRARGDVGLSMDELTAAAQQYGFSVSEVLAALRTLTAEGSVYQTHDNRFNI